MNSLSRKWLTLVVASAVACWLGWSCSREDAPANESATSPHQAPHVVVGTSMIECAVRAVAGDKLLVHRLAPPGQCPGHFDLKPRDFEAIVRSEVILRHDWQEYLDKKLQVSASGKKIVSLPTIDPQTVPVNFLRLCRDVAAGLCEAFPELSPTIEENLRTVEGSVASIASQAREEAAPLSGVTVIASGFQKGFCEWLGLRVAGEFDLADEMSLKGLETLIRVGRDAHAVAVVGNLQRGEREGKPIAQRLGVPLILLSNFPLHPEAPDAYAQLIKNNVQQLLEGCRDVADR